MDNAASERPRFLYLLFGLNVSSELECPELEPGNGSPALFFHYGDVPVALPGASSESLVGEALPGLFLLRIRNTGNFLIRDGREVIIEPDPGSSADALKLFLLGPVLGILLHQRSFLPLHASAISQRDGAVVFAGPTGSGKSTLAAAFLRRGYQVIADEICAVDTSASEVPHVVPAPPCLALWADALGKLDFGLSDLLPVRSDLHKFLLPAARSSWCVPVPLRRCYILDCSNHHEISLEPVTGLRKIEAVCLQTYRRTLIDALNLTAVNFEQACKVSASAKVMLVRRPWGEFTADRVADAIEEDFAA